ncbi:hypothetical protein RND81_13G147100 [Saponaria officinalis]|uniref:Uncharacterized protein n=1 Tax=Saponaria officinalis TaxID=3572 RepID=A0AAW1H003_SAPOF
MVYYFRFTEHFAFIDADVCFTNMLMARHVRNDISMLCRHRWRKRLRWKVCSLHQYIGQTCGMFKYIRGTRERMHKSHGQESLFNIKCFLGTCLNERNPKLIGQSLSIQENKRLKTQHKQERRESKARVDFTPFFTFTVIFCVSKNVLWNID